MPTFHGEEIVLARLLSDIQKGFYLDVGANHPVEASNTWPFYERGWRGICIEPMTELANKFKQVRPDDYIVECVVGDREDTVAFYTRLTTLRKDIIETNHLFGVDTNSIQVRMRTLNSILEEYNIENIDFMNMDIEGSEYKALLGLDLNKYRPRVLCIESVIPHTRTPCWDEWESYVLEHKYLLAHFDGVNRFYVRSEDERRIKLIG
jgi:FkbM family methyltransferase